MKALSDPFSRVHPLFWPVLWLSLRSFVAWTGRLIEDGHGFAAMKVEITWYGWIHVVYLDLSPERARFNRHMLGVAEDDWRDVLARAGRDVEALLAPEDAAQPISHSASVQQSSPACGGGARRAEGARGMRHGCGRSPPSTRMRGVRRKTLTAFSCLLTPPQAGEDWAALRLWT